MNPRSFDIMSVFSGQPAPAPAPAPQPAVAQHSNPATPQDPAFQKSTTEDPKTTDSQQTPLDKHKDLYTIDPKAPKPADPNAPIFSLDKEAMQKAVSSMQFTDNPVIAEKAQAALRGDAGALMEVLNAVSQNVYLQAAQLTATAGETAAKTAMDRALQELPNRVRSMSASETLAELNPAYAHPALKPLVDTARQRYESRFPEASPREIAQMVNTYMADAATQLQQANKQQDPTAHRTVDGNNSNFSDFFGFGTGQ